LLEFIYQGKVNVMKDDIPHFMKAAETLKIKGLTENDNCTTMAREFGMNNTEKDLHQPCSSDYNRDDSSDQHTNMRRFRTKKLIKPIHHLKPLEYPSSTPSPPSSTPSHTSSPIPNKICKSENSTDVSDVQFPTMKLKEEPIDPSDPLNISEQGMCSSFAGATTDDSFRCSTSKSSLDFKSKYTDLGPPGGLLFLKSRKGHPVLIHNGHMYTLSHKSESRSLWVCVKQRTLKCGGCVTTINGQMVISYSGHNHTQLNDVIQRLQASSCSPSPELHT